jgi:hypothetical protein
MKRLTQVSRCGFGHRSTVTFSKTALLAALLAGASLANAGADFTTIARSQRDLDDAHPSLVLNFTLPSNVLLSSTTSDVLDFEVKESELNFNEGYINPPTTVCTADTTDANQAGSIGFLQEHDDANLKTEWATNHKAFASNLLKAGTNTLLICVRNSTGGAGPGVGNLDNVSVRNVVLHYHTQ